MNDSKKPGLFSLWKQKAKKMKREVYALYYAYNDSRVPWYAKLFIMVIVAYAFSPIDLIPDFIPIIGYLDDLVLIPLGVTLAVKMIPAEVMADARVKAEALTQKPKNWIAGLVIILIWAVIIVWLVLYYLQK